MYIKIYRELGLLKWILLLITTIYMIFTLLYIIVYNKNYLNIAINTVLLELIIITYIVFFNKYYEKYLYIHDKILFKNSPDFSKYCDNLINFNDASKFNYDQYFFKLRNNCGDLYNFDVHALNNNIKINTQYQASTGDLNTESYEVKKSILLIPYMILSRFDKICEF